MLDRFTRKEKDEIRRTLQWVLAATQTSEESTRTIKRFIDMLEELEPVSPESLGARE